MEYRAVAFDPVVTRNGGAGGAARDLGALITQQSAEGWEYLGLDNHSSVIAGSEGCFGIGATSPFPVTISIAVFYR